MCRENNQSCFFGFRIRYDLARRISVEEIALYIQIPHIGREKRVQFVLCLSLPDRSEFRGSRLLAGQPVHAIGSQVDYMNEVQLRMETTCQSHRVVRRSNRLSR